MTRLEQLRVDAGLSPEELADVTEVSARTIYRIEGGHGARTATLTKLANHFRVAASDLVRDALPIAERAA